MSARPARPPSTPPDGRTSGLRERGRGGPDPTYYENFIRSPHEPFLANATLDVYDYSSFTNNGAGVTWIPFDPGGTDYHAVTTDDRPDHRAAPADLRQRSGRLDHPGQRRDLRDASRGLRLRRAARFSTDPLADVDRNGNLDITQFYYGAVQPSTAAAEIAGALFYGSSQDNGGPVSDPNILTDGNITWIGPAGDATGVAPTSKAWAPPTSSSGPAAAATTPTSSSTSAPV